MLLLLSTELKNCYTSANFQYNENLKTVAVQIYTTENPLCDQFQNEVKVVVSFHDDYSSIKFIQDNFRYQNYSQIFMQNVTITNMDPAVLDMPKYAFLNISNIAFWTTVRVSEIAKQTSQMDQCFEQSGSSFSMSRDKFTVVLNLTTACFHEIVENAQSFQYQFNNRAGTINIILQRNDPVKYNCWVEEVDGFNYFHCINEQNYLDDVQQAFISPLFQFYVLVGDRVFTTEIRVKEVLVGRVQNFFESIETQFYKDSFYIKYRYTNDTETLQHWKDAIQGYTKIIYRLSVKTPLQDFSYEFNLKSFKITQNYLILQCENQQACLDDLSFINSMIESSRFQLDCFAFDDDSFLASVGQEFNSKLSCFQRTVVQIYSSQRVCFELEKSPFFEYASHCKLLGDGEEVQITAQSILTEQDYKIDFSMKNQQRFYFTNPVFCFNCYDCVNQIDNMRISSIIVVLSGQFDDVQFTSLGSQIQEMSYNTVVIAVSVSGIIFIIYVIYDTISKLMMFMKLAKKYKLRR